MIPRANINAWRAIAPWPESAQVEQDLVIARALVALYSRAEIADGLLFRGGTALHKLYFDPAGRYSEDIDLVQRAAGPIGDLVAVVREALDPWLGAPVTKRAADRFTLSYRFTTTFAPVTTARLKVEINTREHFCVQGIVRREVAVANPWFTGSAAVATYGLSELLATKLRALFQRKKGRDLFDIWLGLRHAETNVDDVLAGLAAYMSVGGVPVTRARMEANLAAKMRDTAFVGDVKPLLRPGLSYDGNVAWREVHKRVVTKLPGRPWRGIDA